MVVKKTVTITPFNLKRKVHIYLPRGYKNSDKRYQVLYMYDGHNLFYDSDATYGKCWGIKDYLDKTRKELIVVGVECNHEGNDRLCEYSPYSFNDRYWGKVDGRGKPFMDWLVYELKPWIDENYRTLPDRDNTGIAGSSMGGLMSVYSIAAYNDTFSKAACLSSFVHKNFSTLVKETDVPMNNTKVYLSWEAKEFRNRPQLAKGTQYNLILANQMIKNGATLYLNQPLNGYHNEESWEREVPVFMEFLF